MFGGVLIGVWILGSKYGQGGFCLEENSHSYR